MKKMSTLLCINSLHCYEENVYTIVYKQSLHMCIKSYTIEYKEKIYIINVYKKKA